MPTSDTDDHYGCPASCCTGMSAPCVSEREAAVDRAETDAEQGPCIGVCAGCEPDCHLLSSVTGSYAEKPVGGADHA